MDVVESGTKRIHVGGLTSSVTEQELKEKFSSFGTIKDIEIKNKKDVNGGDFNTFAYIDIVTDESSIKKCFSIFNKAKWKGRTLQIQFAKQHFLKRLEEERNTPEIPKIKKVRSNFHDPLANLADVEDFNVKGKVPGTPIPGEKKWIVGKYGRVLPIVNVRNRSTNKVDPSKFCHNVKKIKPDNQDENEKLDLNKLTWVMEISEDSDKLKRQRGDFSDFNIKKRKLDNDWSEEMAEKIEELRRRYTTTDEKDNDKNNDIEVVKGKKVVSQYHIPKEDFIYDSDVDIPENGNSTVGSVITESDDSVGSADTDEIIASMNASKQNSKVITKPLDRDIAYSKSNPKEFSAIKNATPVISYVDKTMKMTPFKGIGMLDLSDEDSKILCPLSNASIKTSSFDERNGLPENIVEDIGKSKIHHSDYSSENSLTKKKILKSKTKRDNSRKKINSLDSQNKHDSSETDSDSSEVSSRSRSLVEEKSAKKFVKSSKYIDVLKIKFDESNTEVNKIISRSSDNDSEDTDDIISKLKGNHQNVMADTKQNDKYSCPINVSVNSDSEYDTDDFEKIANKFSSTQQADGNAKTIDEEDEKCSTTSDELSNVSSSENSSNSTSEDNNDSKQISETEDLKEDSDASFIGNEDAVESSDNETNSHNKKEKRNNTRSEKPTKMKNNGDDDHKDEDFKETGGIKDVVEGETENVFVSSSLVSAFTKIDQQSSSGFSFLKTFGKNDITESQTEEIPLKLPWQLTSQDDEEEMIVKRKGDPSSSVAKSSFFFHPKDVRLQEGVEFFHRKMDLDNIEEIWQENKHLFLANCRQRNRLALRRVNQEKLRQRKLPFTASTWGKK